MPENTKEKLDDRICFFFKFSFQNNFKLIKVLQKQRKEFQIHPDCANAQNIIIIIMKLILIQYYYLHYRSY